MSEAPDLAETLAVLERVRPDLVGPYLDAAEGARAAVLARLWGALVREPLAGIRHRQTAGGRTTITFADGRQLAGPAAAAAMFAQVDRLSLTFDGAEHDHPARLLAALPLPGARERLVRELDNSVANLALARAAPRKQPPDGLSDLVDEAQALVDGHPLHPCCRTRIGLSTEDVLKYAPEHHPVVDLHVVEVEPDHWHPTGVPRPPLLPVHPWQLDRVLASGVARDTGATISARPLMSLRTLAPVAERGVHLKTAVDVQMTSAVRTLSPPTVHNGPLASALLKALATKTEGLTILGEPSGASVVLDGQDQRSLACVWREAPPAGRRIVPLAAVTNPSDALFELLLPPLLTMLDLGVALEAHGQNTLIAFAGGRPVHVYYRDVGGIHVSPRRLARAGVEMPPLTGTVPTDDPETLRTKLFAAVFNCVPIQPRQWDTIATIAKSSDERKALEKDTLPLKATTAMRLADDPLQDIWAHRPNPMKR
jgi:staphyloferrin A synthase